MSSLYENWTDVYGVCVADPVKVYGVSTIRSMSYSEMRALSRGGAEVLHPSAISPAERFSIPIKIGNFIILKAQARWLVNAIRRTNCCR